MNRLLAAIDHPDFRMGESAFAEIVAECKLFSSLDEIVKTGSRNELKRAGVQVELLVLLHMAPAGESELRILSFAKSGAGFSEASTLEDAWGARPKFDPVRLKQRLDELQIKQRVTD